jgi:chromosome segregation protein
MRLKKLVLQGYKTFASKTEFVFDDGITAIVGPNGSGKSNIADAVRWVLGEQSYSTLRARRTADMIFAGSQQRARAGMAQATITLDNSDGWLPIDYSEVEIARRAYRSGENEYLINGQQVRLKDVADLLATSGLAERTYTIIGQGLVDQALSLRSDERRALFEEAAGHHPLQSAPRRNAAPAGGNPAQSPARARHPGRNTAAPRLTQAAGHANPKLRADFGRPARFAARLVRLRRLAEVEVELPPISQQREAAASELAAATEELAAAQASLNQAREQLQTFNANFQTQQATINKWQTELQNATQAQRSTQNRVAQLQGQLNQLREQLQEQSANQPSAGEGESVKVQAEVAKLTAVFSTAQQKVDDLRQKRSETLAQRQELIQELKNLRRDQRDQEQQLSRQQKELARLEAQTEMLNQMRQKETAVPDTIKVLANLASILTIPAPHQQAIEAALQTRLGTLLLPDEAALWQLIAGRDPDAALSIAVADYLQPTAPPEIDGTGVIGWADSVVKYDKQFAPLVQLLLGRVLLADGAKTAVSIAKNLPTGFVAAAPDGTVAHAGGLIELVGQSAQDSLLAREAAWREAQHKLAAKKEEVAGVETAVAEQQSLIQSKQEAADELNNEEQRLGRLMNEASQRVSQAQRDLDRQKQQQTFIERQQQAQAEATARLQNRIETLAANAEKDEAEVVRLEAAVSHAQAQLDSLPVAEAQQQRESLKQNIGAEQTIVDGRRAVVDSRRATLNQFEQQLNRLKERQATLLAQQAEMAQSQDEQDRIRLQDQMSELEQQLTPMKARLTELQEELGDVEEETAVSQKEAHDHETIYTQAKIAYSQQQSAIEGLQERIKTDLGIVALHYDEDQTGPTPLPIVGVQALPKITELPDDIEETIHNYRGQMQRMGAINPDAPEEYQETQDRHDFLTEQLDDLNETEARLRKVIEELDELTSRAFSETVDKVNAVFGQTFTQLFGGGAGRLVLTDPDDLTISGVDIIARLPNRREQGLGLLSGGERSLTAAALIFSLLKVSPTPFCIMDEVDAALDEANINRFREELRELALGTQFIVITHNRGTVQAAQTIYGISMGSDSASQAISIKPEEYIKQPELL